MKLQYLGFIPGIILFSYMIREYLDKDNEFLRFYINAIMWIAVSAFGLMIALSK